MAKNITPKTETVTPKAKNVVTPKAEPKKTATPKVETPKKAGAAKKTGLRSPQWRILTCLAKAKAPMSRKQISEKANVDLAFCTEYLGSNDPEKRAANDAKQFPSLITLGHVKFGNDEESKGTVYELTAKGRKEAEKAPKE